MNQVVKLADTGMLVLIWMTQLIVYPGFTYYAENDLIKWHEQYTVSLMFIVGPLMLFQGIGHTYQFLNRWHWKQGIIIGLLIIVWVLTFGYAVPLHNEIAKGNEPLEQAQKLLDLNYYRTIIWTLVFMLNVAWNTNKQKRL